MPAATCFRRHISAWNIFIPLIILCFSPPRCSWKTAAVIHFGIPPSVLVSISIMHLLIPPLSLLLCVTGQDLAFVFKRRGKPGCFVRIKITAPFIQEPRWNWLENYPYPALSALVYLQKHAGCYMLPLFPDNWCSAQAWYINSLNNQRTKIFLTDEKKRYEKNHLDAVDPLRS